MLFPASSLRTIAAMSLSLGTRLFHSSLSVTNTTDCISRETVTSLEQLVECFDGYTVPHGYYDKEQYDAAQPTASQLAAWAAAVSSLLSVNNNCSATVVPASLSGIFAVSPFTDSHNSYCILSELHSDNPRYRKGWGLMVVPASPSSLSRNVHISAPHPAHDLNTPQQAAALFKRINAKSLLIPGRVRTSYLAPTDCVVDGVYYKTDPTHDVVRVFPSPALSSLLICLCILRMNRSTLLPRRL